MTRSYTFPPPIKDRVIAEILALKITHAELTAHESIALSELLRCIAFCRLFGKQKSRRYYSLKKRAESPDRVSISYRRLLGVYLGCFRAAISSLASEPLKRNVDKTIEEFLQSWNYSLDAGLRLEASHFENDWNDCLRDLKEMGIGRLEVHADKRTGSIEVLGLSSSFLQEIIRLGVKGVDPNTGASDTKVLAVFDLDPFLGENLTKTPRRAGRPVTTRPSLKGLFSNYFGPMRFIRSAEMASSLMLAERNGVFAATSQAKQKAEASPESRLPTVATPSRDPLPVLPR
jgi:hypothetical protein